MAEPQPVFLYSTASRQVSQLVPLRSGQVSMYTCGPTVYGDPHIGNFRTYIFEDVLVKTLRLLGYGVNRVMNITDVGHLTSDADDGDDKLEVGAKRDGTTAWEVAKRYEQRFLEGMTALNLEVPVLVRATDTIAAQIAFIRRLEADGHTYQTADGVYFDSDTFPRYADFARLDLDGLQAGARVAMSDKRNPSDFALWKFSLPGSHRDMEWESPWGTGFPGWHIECSAIAMRELGEQLDIHCGGVDHIPVHHTNEIAQTESVTGKPFAQVWMHGEFLLVDGGKMGKSLGNGYTLADLTERGFEPLAFRYFCYSASYRSKLNFTWDGLEAAQTALRRLRAIAQALPAAEPTVLAPFTAVLADDLNTSKFLALIWEALKSETISGGQKRAMLELADQVLGLNLFAVSADSEPIPAEILRLAEARAEARAAKDWYESDRLRDQIAAAGWTLSDDPSGYRLTNDKS